MKNRKFDNTEIVLYESVCGSLFEFNNLPEFQRIGFISSFSKDSFIQTELWLPKEWNGIYVATGNGGMGGGVSYNSLYEYITKGYAVANTDMGTSRGRDAGINNPDMWADFGWRSTHNMTVVSKKIIKEYYGKEADFSYFIGGSTGGQQALCAAQRFPEDYDGIVAALPANNRVFLHTYFLWNHNHLRKPDGTVMFINEEVNIITKTATEYFQTLNDGIKGDKFVSFPYKDRNTVNNFLSFLKNAHPEFSDEQINALRAVYEGPENPSTNAKLYNGMPIGSENCGSGILECQNPESPHYYPFIWAFGADYYPYDFDFNKDIEMLSNILAKDLNANNPDLTAFEKSGGKLLVISGTSDPCVPFPDAMKYTERVADFFDGYENISHFYKLYLMPGKDHYCGTSLGTTDLFDSNGNTELTIVRLWKEKGISPDFLIAKRIKNGKTEFERKIYPYLSSENPQTQFPPSCDDYYLNK